MDNMKSAGRDEKERYYRVITFKAAPEIDQRLREAANNQNVSMSEVIRQSLLLTFTAEQAAKI